MWGVVAGCGGVGCVCGVGMPLWLCLVGAAAGVSLRVGRFTARVAVCPLGCLFVGCVLLCRVLLVCCGLFCLSAIVWCAFRECSCACVMWFMLVGVGARLAATVVVAYCLLCKGCFWQFAARFCVPGVSR